MLGNIKVLDLCDEKGSFCSKLLADLGASVVKVEKPGGDPSRMIGPFWSSSPHPGESLSFFYSNTNKLGITLNLECDAGRELFLKLVRKTDAVIESFMPGYLAGLDIGYDSLRKINPAIIMASITGFGQDGPMRDYKSCDLIASAVGGWMHVSGAPFGEPLKLFGEQSYLTASIYAAIGVLLALQARSKTGKGDHIDISLQEAVLSTLDHVMIRYFHDHVIAMRQGNWHWDNFFCILRCKDGFIHITPFQQWDTLVEWIGSEGMSGDLGEEKWRDEVYRIKYADHVIEVLQDWTMTHTADELFELGQLMQFPWAPIHNLQEVLARPQLEYRNFFNKYNEFDIPYQFKYPGLPYKLSGQFSLSRKAAPLIGEDNINIFRDELGLTEEAIAKLSSEGII